ncbi:MAG: DUF3604 domain-containing protein [Acidobacteria bacterium]|nr:DUF3604 domain-containing protein [Acidobacteriota bacterium]
MHIDRLLAAALAAAFAQFAIETVVMAQGPDLVTGIPVKLEREAHYGDLHLHTSYSFDAHLAFGAKVDPDGAYRFARAGPGEYLDEEVDRATPPLDFMAVTDHAEWIGLLNTLEVPNSALSQSEVGKGLRERSEIFSER